MVAGPLTIVQMLPELEEGGVEQGTLELGKYLARHGHRSIVISGGGRLVGQLQAEGSEHVLWHVGRKSPLTLRYILWLKKFLLREQVDILHLRSRVPAWVGYLAWKSLPASLRPRLVTTFHGFYSVNKYSAVMTKGEKVIAVSRAIEDHIESTYQVPAEKIVLIPEGIDVDYFDPHQVSRQRLQRLSEAWEISNSHTSLIMLPGRITRLKGHDLFLQSLALIKDLPWTAIFVGEFAKKSSYENELKQQIDALGLSQRVIFSGHCTDMAAAYLLSTVVVSATSTQAESFGRTAVEAQAMGRPVIATAHGGSLETVLQQQSGWLVPPGDAEAFAAALREALTDADVLQKYGATGATWVRKNFTLALMCKRTVALYKSLIMADKTFE